MGRGDRRRGETTSRRARVKSEHGQTLRQRQQGGDRAQFTRRSRAVRPRGGEGVRRLGRAGDHRSSARGCTPHHSSGRARDRGIPRADEGADRVQHRRGSARRSAGARARRQAGSVHACPCPSRRNHQPGGLVAADAARVDSTSGGGSSRRQRSREPVRRSRGVAHPVGLRDGCRPGRVVHGTVRACVRARRAACARIVCHLHARGGARALAWTRRQRGARSRSRQPRAVPQAAVPR